MQRREIEENQRKEKEEGQRKVIEKELEVEKQKTKDLEEKLKKEEESKERCMRLWLQSQSQVKSERWHLAQEKKKVEMLLRPYNRHNEVDEKEQEEFNGVDVDEDDDDKYDEDKDEDDEDEDKDDEDEDEDNYDEDDEPPPLIDRRLITNSGRIIKTPIKLGMEDHGNLLLAKQVTHQPGKFRTASDNQGRKKTSRHVI